MAFPGTKHNWSEAETDTLWSYVEKFHEQLYHGKDNLTRPKVLAKITSLLSMSDFSVPCTAVVIWGNFHCDNICHLFADTHLDLEVNKKQVDDKLYHIERCFRSHEAARHSGAADQSPWHLEDRVASVLGEQCMTFLCKPSVTFTLWQHWHCDRRSVIFSGAQPSIKPDTLTSFGNTSEKDAETSPPTSQDAVVPSSGKKLMSRMNQSDKVLTYLKASVSTCTNMVLQC